jgi:hypothetical protein
MGRFLITSLGASLILTVVANAALWAWGSRSPQRRDHESRWRPEADRLSEPHRPAGPDPIRPSRPEVRVYVPWKAMIVASVVLTVVLNVVVWLAR